MEGMVPNGPVLLHCYHDAFTIGISTKQSVRIAKYYWPKMFREIAHYAHCAQLPLAHKAAQRNYFTRATLPDRDRVILATFIVDL